MKLWKVCASVVGGLVGAILILWFLVIWGDNPVIDEKLEESILLIFFVGICVSLLGVNLWDRDR